MHDTEFFQNMRCDFEDWQSKGECDRAKKINEQMGREYFDTANPHYFTGAPSASLVLVHLNPQRNMNLWHQRCGFTCFDEYLDFYQHFGRFHYGVSSDRKHKSRFDQKQVRFLEAFDVLPFTGNKYADLELVIDGKLQLELVPYGSPNFDSKAVPTGFMGELIRIAIDVINQHPREYVIFCGAIFRKLLKPWIVCQQEHKFRMQKKDGTQTANEYSTINIRIQVEHGKCIEACVAPQYTKRVGLEEPYGKKVHELYHVR